MIQSGAHHAPVRGIYLLALLLLLFPSFANAQSRAVQEKISRIDEQTKASRLLQREMATDMMEMRRAIMTMTGQLEEFNERARTLTERIESMERAFAEISHVYRSKVLERSAITDLRLERLRTELQDLAVESAAFYKLLEKKNDILGRTHRATVADIRKERGLAAPGPKKKPVSPDDVYQQAYTAYIEGRMEEAIKGFEQYLRSYPKTSLSDNAAYWIGEVWYGRQKYREAGAAFDRMVENYPTSLKASAALLRSAYAALEQGETERAIERFAHIVNDYPTSSEAVQAEERLAVLRPEPEGTASDVREQTQPETDEKLLSPTMQ